MRILFLSLLLTFNVLAADTAVVMSSHSDKTTLKSHIELTKDIYKKLPLGGSLSVHGDDEILTTLEVPEKAGYKSAKARMKLRRKEIALLNSFEKQAKGDSNRPGALDVPKLFNDIGLYQSEVTDIVVIGSPRYATSYPALDMKDNMIVRDGVFLKDRGDNPFSVKGKETLLKGKRIHWLLPASESGNGSLYSDALLRFWGAYISQMSGSLVTFSPSKDVVLKRLLQKSQPLNLSFQLERSGKIGLQAVRNISDEGLFNLSVNQSVPAIEHVKQKLTIAIEWGAKGADLDLWAMPIEDGKALHYDLQTTQYGVHTKDIRDGREASLESINFTKAIDVRSLVVLVNIYHADKAQPVNGSLRVKLDGKVYEKAFSFAESRGNKGQDVNPLLTGGEDTLYSKRFSVMDIVGVAI